MRVQLSSLTFDLQGHVVLDALGGSEVDALSRRVSRVATLDGGAVLNDFGHSDADRTLRLRWRPGRAVDEVVRRMVRLYGRLRVALPDGLFVAAPQGVAREGGDWVLVLLVLERLTP